jgi:hypothetical protein
MAVSFEGYGLYRAAVREEIWPGALGLTGCHASVVVALSAALPKTQAAAMKLTVWACSSGHNALSSCWYSLSTVQVLHLVTTAHGVEDIYMQQKANNPARSENAEQARELGMPPKALMNRIASWVVF